MNKIFVDTWGWLTLADEKEKQHRKILQVVQDSLRKGVKLYSSDAVLSETITLLFRRLPREKAIHVMEIILGQEGLQKISISPERFDRAVQLRKQYADQPLISFTDLLSFVIMDEYSIPSVITEDHHFDIMHFGFQRVTG